jgi:hypothetical protein
MYEIFRGWGSSVDGHIWLRLVCGGQQIGVVFRKLNSPVTFVTFLGENYLTCIPMVEKCHHAAATTARKITAGPAGLEQEIPNV